MLDFTIFGNSDINYFEPCDSDNKILSPIIILSINANLIKNQYPNALKAY